MATATASATSSASKGMSANTALGAMGAIGVVSDLFGQIMAGREAKSIGKFNQQMTEIQSRIYQTSADFEVARMRSRADELFKAQEATYIKSGVTFEGSPAEVMMKSYAESELDILVTQWKAKYMIGQEQLQGRMARMEGYAEANRRYAAIPATLINAGTKAYKDNWFAKKGKDE